MDQQYDGTTAIKKVKITKGNPVAFSFGVRV